MKTYSHYLIIVIALVSLILRLYGLSHGTGVHPDERHIMMVADRLSINNLDPDFFAYGSFPFYLLWVIAEILGYFNPFLSSYDGFFLVGRAISAFFGAIAVFLVFKISIKLYASQKIALLSAGFLAMNFFHIQLSHFYAFDGVLTTLNLAALFFLLNISNANCKIIDFIISGIFIGLSFATKISSLSLFLPLTIALSFNLHEQKKIFSFPLLIKASLLFIVSFVTFILVEPYALIRFDKFIADNLEQIRMVRGDWRPPYTVQYAKTIPYIYHLEQIFNYTVGPLLSICGIFGIFLAISKYFKSFKHFNKNELIICIWFLAVFLIIGRYQVKFPRYLLPLYPIFFIFAAKFIFNIISYINKNLKFRYKKILTIVLLTFLLLNQLVRGTSLLSVYSKEHIYKTSSVWIFNNIPGGSRLLQGHWDDTLPLHLPGLNPDRYQSTGIEHELPLYEVDTPQKLDLISKRTANNDYIIFPTTRLTGSLTILPDEFQNTNNYLKLLFAGNLGYKLEKVFKVYPAFSSFYIDTDLADESISVYDHPKVTIFKNTEHLTANQIKERILNPESFKPLLERRDILTIKPQTETLSSGFNFDSLYSLIKWYLCIQLLSISLLPILNLCFNNFPDKAYGISKTFGIFIFGMTTWLLPAYTGIKFSSTLCSLVFILLICSAIFVPGNLAFYKNIFLKYRNNIIPVELLFSLSLLFFITIRWINPEIFWGEKPMDSSFLHYFVRLESFPPLDPWASGNGLRYYYLGTYFIASLLKLTAIPAAIGYNLAIASLPALCLVSLYSLFLILTRKKLFAIFASLSVLLVSNPEILNLIFMQGKNINFDTFWASTRLFTPPGFTEFPLWSFLFADLHAHVISQVFCCMLLAMFASLISTKTRESKYYFLKLIITVSVLASLMPLNSWDFIVYSILFGLIIFSGNLRKNIQIKNKCFVRFVTSTCFDILISAVIMLLILLPYLRSANPETAASYNFNHSFEFNTLGQFLRHFGTWILLFFIGSFAFILKHDKKNKLTILQYSLLLLVSIIPILLGLFCFYNDINPPPWGILIMTSMLILISMYGLLQSNSSLLADFAYSSMLCVSLLIGFIEVFFLIDRMNSIFKFYNCFWFIISSSSMALSYYAFQNVKKSCLIKRIYSHVNKTIIYLTIFICFAGSVCNIYVTVLNKRTDGPRFTLNGQAYIENHNLPEYQMINWINNNIKGTATVLEAQGDSYGPFTRIVMHTGLSTVLGWEHHVKQRGTKENDLYMRRKDIKLIYGSTSTEVAEDLLDKYQVELIVIGELERKTYSSVGLKKFEDNPGKFLLLFKSGATSLYARSESMLSRDDNSKLELRWK